jgi:transposase
MRRAGAPVDRQLVTQNFHAFCSFAEPLLGAMESDLLESELLHVDGSFMFRHDGKRRRRCTRSPVYAICDGDQVLFRWRENERHETAADLITGYSGYLVRDEWEGWSSLKADVTHIGCNAHARRYFATNQDDVDARAMVHLYAKLYAVERSGLHGTVFTQHRLELRRRHSVAIMDEIHARAVAIVATRTGKMASSARYIIKHRAELRRFLDNGSLPPDNNLAERVLRRHAMLRNNRRFFVAENGGSNLATALSLTGSCRLLDLSPMAYLQAVLPVLFEHRRAKKLGLALPDLRPWTPAAYARQQNQVLAA